MQHRFMLLRAITTCAVIALVLTACNNSKEPSPNQFDRTAMLTRYADAVLIPRFNDLALTIATLNTAIEATVQNPAGSNLADIKVKWVSAVTAWQQANAFNIGPAAEAGLKKGLLEEIGTFPCDTAQIEAFITAQDYSLNNFKRNTRGFYAVEYLLYRSGSALLTNEARLLYLKALSAHLLAETDRVKSEWVAYRSEFLANNGTDAGSSPSMLYNEFVRSFESIKNFKVGLPAGKRAGQTGPQPELAEAFFSGTTLDLLKAHVASIEAIYNGADGVGMRAWLNSTTGGPELITASDAQWTKVKEALAAVPTQTPLASLMAEQHPSIDVLHTELQKQTRFFKSDMSSLLGVAITFSSGDGD
jgi:uncharacterized protein